MTTGPVALDQFEDVAAEYAAAALQALHVEDLLEHIPVFKSGLVAAKVIGSVRDHLLLRKVAIFLHAISVALGNPKNSEAIEVHTIPLFHANGWGSA